MFWLGRVSGYLICLIVELLVINSLSIRCLPLFIGSFVNRATQPIVLSDILACAIVCERSSTVGTFEPSDMVRLPACTSDAVVFFKFISGALRILSILQFLAFIILASTGIDGSSVSFSRFFALIVELTKNAELLAQTKLVEIFASKAENIQIFFTDFFNIYDVYNRPGTSGDENWSLRLPDNFKDLNAINLAKILKLAIIARGKEFADKNSKLIEELGEV